MPGIRRRRGFQPRVWRRSAFLLLVLYGRFIVTTPIPSSMAAAVACNDASFPCKENGNATIQDKQTARQQYRDMEQEEEEEEEAQLQPSKDIVERSDNAVTADSLLYPWLVQLIGCASLFVIVKYNDRIPISVPYAGVMFIWGALLGIFASSSSSSAAAATAASVPFLDDNNNEEESTIKLRQNLIDSVKSWINIDSSTLLLIFLPGLIFKDAIEMPIDLFEDALVQIWTLAFPAVLVGTAFTSLVSKYCLPYDNVYYGGYSSWLALGAILASTDPIAVSSVLKKAGASPRLMMHISGESLLNDGSSYVFFTIAANTWYKSLGITPNIYYDTAGGWIGYFFQMSFGGSLFGYLFASCLIRALDGLNTEEENNNNSPSSSPSNRRLKRRKQQNVKNTDFEIIQVVLCVTSAYLCYYVCDQMLRMSGILATISLGYVVNRYSNFGNDRDSLSSYLALADFLLNTLLFALAGTIWGGASCKLTLADFGWLLVFYVSCVLIRFVQIAMFYPIISRIGLKSNWREGLFLAYGGLHGSVGIALGLNLLQYVFQNTSDPEARKAVTIIQFLGGGATFLTLTINGTSAGYVLKFLGLINKIEKRNSNVELTSLISTNDPGTSAIESSAKEFCYDESKLSGVVQYMRKQFLYQIERLYSLDENDETIQRQFKSRRVRAFLLIFGLVNIVVILLGNKGSYQFLRKNATDKDTIGTIRQKTTKKLTNASSVIQQPATQSSSFTDKLIHVFNHSKK